MAKVPYTKLGLSKDKMNQYTIIEFNNQAIEVKQYLPINEKLELISRVINKAADENNFSNPVKLDVYTALEIIYAYTNINFTEKQKEDEIKLYDLFISSGLWELVVKAVPENEFNNLREAVGLCSDAVYTYRNSVLGILETIGTDYSNLSFDIDALKNNLGDPDNLNLVRDVLTKLG